MVTAERDSSRFFRNSSHFKPTHGDVQPSHEEEEEGGPSTTTDPSPNTQPKASGPAMATDYTPIPSDSNISYHDSSPKVTQQKPVRTRKPPSYLFVTK